MIIEFLLFRLSVLSIDGHELVCISLREDMICTAKELEQGQS